MFEFLKEDTWLILITMTIWIIVTKYPIWVSDSNKFNTPPTNPNGWIDEWLKSPNRTHLSRVALAVVVAIAGAVADIAIAEVYEPGVVRMVLRTIPVPNAWKTPQVLCP